MKELPYPHGATEIQEHLVDLFDEWEISSKITAMVTDNGLNIKKAYNNMNIGERVPCAIHTLQLSIGKGLDIAKVLIDKCKCLIAVNGRVFGHPKKTQKYCAKEVDYGNSVAQEKMQQEYC